MKSTVPRRGVQDIHTMSERISDADNPQRKYLALGMLELEKARRTKEKRTAIRRVANIDQRLAEITAAQRSLFAAAKTELRTTISTKRRRSAADLACSLKNGFKLTY